MPCPTRTSGSEWNRCAQPLRPACIPGGGQDTNDPEAAPLGWRRPTPLAAAQPPPNAPLLESPAGREAPSRTWTSLPCCRTGQCCYEGGDVLGMYTRCTRGAPCCATMRVTKWGQNVECYGVV
ncbi:hypothetical protein NDU88_000397 [Pleurodeles waltl]|uniref:Uncharacterized protein n=1 Tax=Pleurodeles waltl TaxID=8319 RepID=A0AAV7L6R4_PLEWA|nr:hypothetical protein NDU88_000397 [Pleurodeles waltl]